MNAHDLQKKLIAVARATPSDSRVPYAFEKRIMARIKSAQADVWSVWSSLLWRAAIPSLCVMVLAGAFAGYGQFSSTEREPASLETALMAPIAADSESW
jgi:hypothetical protein